MFDVLIIGAGINGLAAAYYLSHHKNVKVSILEQFEIGHALGSSHGNSRITRISYANPKYIQCMQKLHSELWPSLEKELGEKLICKNTGCFFGKGERLNAFVKMVMDFQLDVELLEIVTARKLFPQRIQIQIRVVMA